MTFTQLRSKLTHVRTAFFCLLVLSIFSLTCLLMVSFKSPPIFLISSNMKSNVSSVFINMPTSVRAIHFNDMFEGRVIKDTENTNLSDSRFKVGMDKAILSQMKTVKQTMQQYPLDNGENRASKNANLSKRNVEASNGISENKEEYNTTNAVLEYDTFENIVQDERTAVKGQRQDTCDGCFKHDFKYVIENDDICKLFSNSSEIILLILILTEHRNLLQRNTLRETWLTYSRGNTVSVRYAFLLGEVKDQKLRDKVMKENNHFRDILKESFIDSYANLTYKTIMGFKWAITKCSVAKFVMKTDDDMFVHVPNVLNMVRTNASLLQTHMVGACSQRARPIRNQKSKWYASISSYPRKYYPGFCSGTGYVTSMNVVNQVYRVSPYVPFFHLEDVYVSLCIQRIGYHLKAIHGFNMGRPKLKPCQFKTNNKLLTAHHLSTGALKRIWTSSCAPGPRARPMSWTKHKRRSETLQP